MEDNDILNLFFARQEKALHETQRKYGGRLFCTAVNILRNDQDAEECVSDTLHRAWETIPPTRPVMFGAFLAKITRNLSLNKRKAQRTARRGGDLVDLLLSELEDCIPANRATRPEEAFESQLVTQAINTCLSALDQTARMAFVLRYFHGESIANICKRFNMGESKVKSLLFRTRKKLRVHLEKEGLI